MGEPVGQGSVDAAGAAVAVPSAPPADPVLPAGAAPDPAPVRSPDGPPDDRWRPSRRGFLLTAAGSVAAAGLGTGGALWYRSGRVDVPLLSSTVAVTGAGSRTALGPGAVRLLRPGSRVLASAVGAAGLHAAESDWLARAAAWTRRPGPHADLVRGALLDLRSLLLPGGVAVAGWAPHWRYVWPRDAAHVAVALARAGLVDDALAVLRFLARVQRPDGWFEARYLMDGSGPPDDRPAQLDGIGWTLWALEAVTGPMGDDAGSAGTAARARLRPTLDRCTALALRLTAGPDGLPPVSPDYWEVSERSVTLGTVAPLRAGLEAAARVYRRLDDPDAAGAGDRAAAGAERLAAAVRRTFGPAGYPRHADGDRPDAAIAFMLPPYLARVEADVLAAFDAALPRMRRPAGGLAPGAGWKRDGISWTPETALAGLAAAAVGRPAAAAETLSWLAAHRTADGSLPEKVLHDGRPASVAPLSWTAALVVLTAAELAGA